MLLLKRFINYLWTLADWVLQNLFPIRFLTPYESITVIYLAVIAATLQFVGLTGLPVSPFSFWSQTVADPLLPTPLALRIGTILPSTRVSLLSLADVRLERPHCCR